MLNLSTNRLKTCVCTFMWVSVFLWTVHETCDDTISFHWEFPAILLNSHSPHTYCEWHEQRQSVRSQALSNERCVNLHRPLPVNTLSLHQYQTPAVRLRFNVDPQRSVVCRTAEQEREWQKRHSWHWMWMKSVSGVWRISGYISCPGRLTGLWCHDGVKTWVICHQWLPSLVSHVQQTSFKCAAVFWFLNLVSRGHSGMW